MHKKIIGTGLCAAIALLIAASSAAALDDTKQVIVVGNSQVEGGTLYAGPGMSNVFSDNFPNTGLGEQAASVMMPAGTLSNLRVNVVTATTPASGTFRARVRINGADTNLTCTVSGTGTCRKNVSIAVPNNALVVVKASNTFSGSGNITFSASLEFD